ncbi:MAG: division/cell wall cluster transcriptional repressor MraZ [Actinomycetota bacterium]
MERSSRAVEHPGESRAQGTWELSARMLLGEFRHALDAKGRLFVPSRWRDELTGTVVVSRWMEHCLSLMTTARFQEIADAVRERSHNNEAGRHYSRALFSRASEEQVDRQGRLTIPASLREWAGLGDEAVLAGVSDHVEIWTPAAWEEYQARMDGQFEEMAAKLDAELHR